MAGKTRPKRPKRAAAKKRTAKPKTVKKRTAVRKRPKQAGDGVVDDLTTFIKKNRAKIATTLAVGLAGTLASGAGALAVQGINQSRAARSGQMANVVGNYADQYGVAHRQALGRLYQ